MNRLIRQTAEALLVRVPRRTAAGDRLVLTYHNVVERNDQRQGDASLHLLLDDFDRQLKLAQQEADVVALTELLDAPTGASARRTRLIAVTFDDAYASAMRVGLDACTARKIAATVVVTPSLLGTLPPWDALALAGEWSDQRRQAFLWDEHGLWRGERPAPDVSEVRIASMLISTQLQLNAAIFGSSHVVGNHTMDHANLGSLDDQQAHAQIQRAHDWLQDAFSHQFVSLLSYPYGIPPRDLDAAMQGTSVSAAFLVEGGWMRGSQVFDRRRLPRWNVPAGVSDRGFLARLRGWLGDR